MPIQIIITGTDANDTKDQMAAFLNLQLIREPVVAGSEPITNAVNGDAGTTEAPPKKTRAGRKPKEPEAEKQDEAADQKQDDADERAEAAKAPINHDSIRASMNEYVELYGIDHATADLAFVFNKRFPDGSVKKISDIPVDMVGRIHADVGDLLRGNPFKHERAA